MDLYGYIETLAQYAYMTKEVMETYGVDEAEAEELLLTSYGIAKPESS